MAYPYLSEEALQAFSLLGSPVYVYSFVTQRVCWSNAPAWAFWDAASGTELHERELGPYSTATATRLNEYREEFRRGAERLENWTFYPNGKPTSALCRCSGVRLDGHDEAMLVEVHALRRLEMPVSELRALEALRHTPLKITLFAENGEVLMRNPAATAAFGPGSAENGLRSMFADAADYETLLRQAEATGVGHVTAAMALPGWPVHAVQLSMVTDPVTGAPAALVAQQDISELVRVSRQLAASEDALDAVLRLDVAPTLVVTADDSRVLRANHAAEALLGPVEGAALTALTVDPARFDRLRAAVLTQGSAADVLELRCRGESAAWCSVSGARIVFEGRDALILLVTNVDELRQSTAELEAALDLERRTSRMQRRYMALASHEFRAPLAVIDSAAQQIERRAATLGPHQVESRAARIRDAVRRLQRLYDETLERAAADLGTMGYAPASADLREIVRDVADGFAADDPRLSIALDLPALPALQLDRGLIERALHNLIGNAVKYSDPPVRVEISASAGIEAVTLSLRDHGIGIPLHEREAVFADGARGGNVGARPGSGIGLSLVRQVAELHGGQVTIAAPETGPGTIFRLTLPRPR